MRKGTRSDQGQLAEPGQGARVVHLGRLVQVLQHPAQVVVPRHAAELFAGQQRVVLQRSLVRRFASVVGRRQARQVGALICPV